MASKAGVYDELLLVAGFGELEEQDLGGEVVYVGDSKADQGLLELVSYDL